MSFPRYSSYRDSGVEWLGEVPTHWTSAPLKRGFSVRLGKMLQPERRTAMDEGLPYLRAANIQPNGVDLSDVREMWFSPQERTELELFTEDLLVSEGGDVGRAALWLGADKPHFFQNSINRIRSRSANETRFLFYWLAMLKAKGYIDTLCNKATIAHFTAEKVEAVEVAYPQPHEQQSIVAFLDRETGKIDALAEEQKRLIDLLKEKRQALISHTVTKGLNPDAPMKDSGVEWLGEVPAHWEVTRLKRISPEITVGIVVEPSKYYVDDGVPALRSLNVRQGAIELEDCVFISKESNERLRKSQLRAGDLVAVRTGQPGTTAIIPSELDGCNCIDLIIIRKPEAGSERYLCWYLASDLAARQFTEGSGGAIQQHFNVGTATDLVITWPTEPEQEAIVAFLDATTSRIDSLTADAQAAIALLQERRAALISAAVTGKIDVRGTSTRTEIDKSRLRLILGATIIEAIAHKTGSGRTKAHKITYLAETHAGIRELDGSYARQAAGPLDWNLITETEAQLQSSGHITVEQPDGHGTPVTYKIVGQRGAFHDELRNVLGSRAEALHRLITDLADLDTRAVEAIATLYAVWNDALIDGAHPTDADIVCGVLNDWHPDKKKKFTASELQIWLDWMRRHQLVPKGQGPRTQLDRLFA